MLATVTIYANPVNQVQVIQFARQAGIDGLQFFPGDLSLLSWVGQATISVSSVAEALELERTLLMAPLILDAEIVPDFSAVEYAFEERLQLVQETLSSSKRIKPEPGWWQHDIHFYEALEYAQEEYKAGRGYFDIITSKESVALIDTGYSGHPETIGFNRMNGVNFMPGEDISDPLDTLESTRPFPIRWGGHGTSCAGLIIGKDAEIPPANRIPYKHCYFDDRVNGLLPQNIDLIPYRVSKNIISFSSRMADAINHIIHSGKEMVISMSHASLINRKIYYAATREAYERGIILVAAPGSHVFGSKRVFTYPARYEETIAPAASTSTGEPWRLTHGGPEVDLSAPGFDMYIPWPFKTKEGQLGYVYKWSEGSSFAVPIVATAAALWRMHHGKKLNGFEPVEQVELFRQIIQQTATPFKEGDTSLYGPGILNVREMLGAPLKLQPSTMKKRVQKISAQSLFTEDKKKASLQRELQYILLQHSFSYPAFHTEEAIAFFADHGSLALRNWLHTKVDKKQCFHEW